MQVRDLSLSFGTDLIFSDVNLLFQPGYRYGLVGANGAGKTSFLKILSDELEASSGGVEKVAGSKIGILQQDHFHYEKNKVVDVVIAGNPRLAAALVEKEELLSAEWQTAYADRLGELEMTIAEEDGYEAVSQAERLLTGLGIQNNYQHGPMSALSGGYKLRVLLAQLLFQAPDIMLLDEPTNHLDIVSISWLEQYLMDYFNGVLIFISHDRHFLNRLSSHIVDVDYRTILLYHGNYDKFIAGKALRSEQQESARENEEREKAHLQDYVDRFRYKASKAKQAQSKIKQIEKLNFTQVQETTRRAPHFSFTPSRPSGKTVLEVKTLSKSFADKKVLENVSFHISRSEKIAVIGANGLGKSTLLKVLLAQHLPSAGEFEWGHNCVTAYVAQDHHESLNAEMTVQDYLEENSYGKTAQQVRNTLGQVLFQKDSVHKSTQKISGGEAARLLLARMMLSQANVLLLDEPTNHLDMESSDALAQALKQTSAAVIVVSHDRAFISAVAERLLVLTPEGLVDFKGNYTEYLASGQEDYVAGIVTTKKEKKAKNKSKVKSKKQQPDLAKIEKQITVAEKRQGELEKAFSDPTLYEAENKSQLDKLKAEQAELENHLQQLYEKWETGI